MGRKNERMRQYQQLVWKMGGGRQEGGGRVREKGGGVVTGVRVLSRSTKIGHCS